MLIKESCPFKKTLHLPARDFRRLLVSPFQLSASVENVKGLHPKVSSLVLEAPSLSSIVGIELRRIELLLSDNFKGHLTLFLQYFDGQGRPSSEPVALLSTKDNMNSNFNIKISLQTGEKVRLIFHCNGITEKDTVNLILFSGVCIMIPGRIQPSKIDEAKTNSWSSIRLVFQAKEGVPAESCDDHKREALARQAKKRERSSSSEPPQLVHAFVEGGDDES